MKIVGRSGLIKISFFWRGYGGTFSFWEKNKYSKLVLEFLGDAHWCIQQDYRIPEGIASIGGICFGPPAALCRLPVSAFDFPRRHVRIDMKKVKQPALVALDADLLLDVSRFISDFKVEGVLFGFSRIRAYKMIREYAESAGLKDIHPHKFRYGLAIHLLQQGVPIPVISARQGHASVYVTMSMHMKVTPEIQAEIVKHVERLG